MNTTASLRRPPAAAHIAQLRDILPTTKAAWPSEAVLQHQYRSAALLLDAMLAPPIWIGRRVLRKATDRQRETLTQALRRPTPNDISFVHQLLLATDAPRPGKWLGVIASALKLRLQESEQ